MGLNHCPKCAGITELKSTCANSSIVYGNLVCSKCEEKEKKMKLDDEKLKKINELIKEDGLKFIECEGFFYFEKIKPNFIYGVYESGNIVKVEVERYYGGETQSYIPKNKNHVVNPRKGIYDNLGHAVCKSKEIFRTKIFELEYLNKNNNNQIAEFENCIAAIKSSNENNTPVKDEF